MIGSRRRQHRAPLVLVGVIVGLGILILAETQLFRRTVLTGEGEAAQRKLATATVDAPQFRLPPLSNFAAVVARPLFSETRRPAFGSASVGDAQSAMFTLVGIVMSRHDRYALVEHGRPPRLDRAHEGQELDGWTVATILPDHVVFQRGERNFELKFPDHSAPPTPSPLSDQAVRPPSP